MKVSEVISNITEIQEPNWADNISDDIIEKIEANFWLVWMKLKLISDIEIIEPLVKISKFLTIKQFKDGKLNVKMRDVDFRVFYKICIDLIPKKKYKFISPKKKHKKDYDYEFLKLLAKDLGESIKTCEDYYDIFEELGIIETEKLELFTKYGIQYRPKSNDIIELININSINVHPKRNIRNLKNQEYFALLEKIKTFGLLEPIFVDKKTSYIVSGHTRYQCYKELKIDRVPIVKKEFKFDILKYINFEIDKGKLLSERINEYHKLNQEIKKLGYKKRTILMGGLNMRDYLFKQTGISQSQSYKLDYIDKSDRELYNKVIKEEISITKAYNNLKKSTSNSSN